MKGVINMSTLPTFESILLEINQSFGGVSFSTDKKKNFLPVECKKKYIKKCFSKFLKI